MAITETEAAAHVESVMDQLNIRPEDRKAFTASFIRLANTPTFIDSGDDGPRAELKYRLNCRVRGEDPGYPVNVRYWRGAAA